PHARVERLLRLELRGDVARWQWHRGGGADLPRAALCCSRTRAPSRWRTRLCLPRSTVAAPEGMRHLKLEISLCIQLATLAFERSGNARPRRAKSSLPPTRVPPCPICRRRLR